MLEEYFDDFKALLRIHHSVGGLYVTDCFLSNEQRSQEKNILPLGFVPRGISSK